MKLGTHKLPWMTSHSIFSAFCLFRLILLLAHRTYTCMESIPKVLEATQHLAFLWHISFLAAMCLFRSNFSGQGSSVPSGLSRLHLAGYSQAWLRQQCQNKPLSHSQFLEWLEKTPVIIKTILKLPSGFMPPPHCKGKQLWVFGYLSILILICALSLVHLQVKET